MRAFVPGLQLNEAFYHEIVKPLIRSWPHAAGRLGDGSDVLGFDTARSTDHGWGPQLVVLVDSADIVEVRAAIDAGLPEEFQGWPVRYGWDDVSVTHHVRVDAIGGWLKRELGIDASQGLSARDWLLIPQQKLLQVTTGAVYHDDSGELEAVRGQLAWYPDDVWRWMLAAQWQRVAQEEAFVGRCAEVGDELGARLITARLARELMRVCFLLAKTYWPYTKWFGSGFARLTDTAEISELLDRALGAADDSQREAALLGAAELVTRRHNATGITPPVDPTPRAFYTRPWRVLGAERLVVACLQTVEDHSLRALPLVGSVDQVADSTDLLGDPRRARRLAELYNLED